jgi:hypothetical protein
VGRKKKETVEPEIVSIAPTEKTIAVVQKEAQLQSTLKDIQEFLPKLQDARQEVVNMILEAFTVDPEDQKAVRQKLVDWMRSHPKDATAALSTLNAIITTIVKPAQMQTTSRKRRRYAWKTDTGTEMVEEEVEITATPPEA